MGRAVNEASITTPNARSKLPAGKTVRWRAIDRGAHIGYRKGRDGGVWVVRSRLPDGKYVTAGIGQADDGLAADGVNVLNFSQAQIKARQWCEIQNRPDGDGSGASYTVADAMADYQEWFSVNRKSGVATRQAIDAHILPSLGKVEVAALTTRQIRRWHTNISQSPGRLRSSPGMAPKTRGEILDPDHPDFDPEAARRRKATANRVLTVLKAALNHAFFESDRVSSADAWNRVRPFPGVDQAKVRYLSENECRRLVNACPPDGFRDLVKAALLTGSRYGELCDFICADFNPDSGTVLVRESKGGKSRHVFLSEEGQRWFARVTAGRAGDAVMLMREDGTPWGRSHQQRPLAAACKAAKIRPAVSFHILRHTHASQLAMRGVPMAVIAAQLGHADTRICERHYAHLAPSYVSSTIRAGLPELGIVEDDGIEILERRTERVRRQTMV